MPASGTRKLVGYIQHSVHRVVATVAFATRSRLTITEIVEVPSDTFGLVVIIPVKVVLPLTLIAGLPESS